MNKYFIKFICAFIPSKKLRKEIRNKALVNKFTHTTLEDQKILFSRMNEYNNTNFLFHNDRLYNQSVWVSGCVKVDNLSGGFHGILFDWIEKYKDENFKDIGIVCENDRVITELHGYLSWVNSIRNIVNYSDNIGSDYDVDLNIIQNFKPEFDIVISQALLEHVSNPINVIQNCLDTLYTGGILLLHTEGVKYPYHKYPIDCLRFHEDFFEDIQKYLNIKMLDYLEIENTGHIFVIYKKL